MKLFDLLKAVSILLVSLFFTFCTSENEDVETNAQFPVKFKVDIPSSISRATSLKNGKASNLSGQLIYQHLNNFVNVGESAAEIVEGIMLEISKYGLTEPMDFEFTNAEDGRIKRLVVVNNSEFDGIIWKNQLSISDVDNTLNADEGLAIQVFWNYDPISGVAILKPSNWNTDDSVMQNTLFKVEYSEAMEYGYETHMVVSISNWEEDYSEIFHMDDLKMFVGKTGDVIDVYGNSIHPDAFLLLEQPKGFCWAFVASSSKASNISVAQVGLPPHTLDETNRSVLLEDYSIENVLTGQVIEWVWQTENIHINHEVASKYLAETKAPGFFNADGFSQAGEAPSINYDKLVTNISLLTPYNPKTIDEQTIQFKLR